jgi:menaquinone-dependent protoporphyrinogen oxidase
MKVLVTVASRHGSSWLIGDAIREELVATGAKVTLIEPELVESITDFDAVVLGSGVYAGRWLGPARTFAKRHEAELAGKPLWLFSSGPIGDPAKPTQPPVEALELAQRLHARDHQVFEGRLERDLLGFGERAIVRVVGAESGDYRPWVAITTWARGIATALERELRASLAEPVAAG